MLLNNKVIFPKHVVLLLYFQDLQVKENVGDPPKCVCAGVSPLLPPFLFQGQ